MAIVPITPPPAPQHKVDAAETVDYVWHEWFTRLWRFVNSLYDLIVEIQNKTIIFDSGITPYFIPGDETFIVPINKQSMFEMTIAVEGILVVDGFLIQVS